MPLVPDWSPGRELGVGWGQDSRQRQELELVLGDWRQGEVADEAPLQ